MRVQRQEEEQEKRIEAEARRVVSKEVSSAGGKAGRDERALYYLSSPVDPS